MYGDAMNPIKLFGIIKYFITRSKKSLTQIAPVCCKAEIVSDHPTLHVLFMNIDQKYDICFL